MTRCYFVVPERDDEQHRCSIDSTSEKPKQVERRLVRPMYVFDDEERGRAVCKDIEKSRKQLRTMLRVSQQLPRPLSE